MTEKQLFYPLLSVYFSLILGDLQKEKLQIVSIFRFGHKKRGLFQCPPKGREFHGEVPFWVSLRGEGTNLLYTICLILFVFLICNVEIRVLVFLIILGWSVLIVASHIIRGIWSMG